MKCFQKEINSRYVFVMAGSLAVLIALGAGFFAGSFFARNREAAAALIAAKQQADAAFTEKQSRLRELEESLSEQEALFRQFQSYREQQEALTAALLAQENQSLELAVQIAALEEELKTLTAKRDEILYQPVVLSAGFYRVGEDLPAARYDIHLLSGNGNLFVTGSLSINEVFGTYSQYGYIQDFKNAALAQGDQIEIRNDLKLEFRRQ